MIRSDDALLVVDMQPDFMPGGALPVVGAHAIIDDIGVLMHEFYRRDALVVATQDWHPANHVSFASVQKRDAFATVPLYGHGQTVWPDHCVQGTPGAALHHALPTEPIGLVVRKGTNWRVDSYSAFKENWAPDGKRYETGLMGYLLSRRIKSVTVVGLARDYCCLWTAADAAYAGALRTQVVWDLTRAVEPANDAETRRQYLEAGVLIV